MKILLIDDEIMQRRLYKKIFEHLKLDLDVSCCHDALSLDWTKYDTVLVDIMMPTMTGHDLIRMMAQKIGIHNMPHIILFSVLDVGRLAELATELQDNGIVIDYQTKLNGYTTITKSLLEKIYVRYENSTN